ncbi:MAG: right-handed parallel beta-helix repeat-containing protein, partial [Pseudomonadales bacterium]|nr:right-handed parallel beta-helix repeat-containing protein [Pseudomonadales bacterium]
MLALAVSGSAKTWADTIEVSDGENLNTIIGAAAPGSRIVVADGDYANIIIGTEELIIEAATGASPQLAGISGSRRVVDIRANDIVLRGFTIAAPDDHVAISISGQNVTVENNSIVSGLTGIQTTTANSDGNALVQNNQISGTGYGLSIQNNNNTFSGNTVQASTEGLGLIGNTDNNISDNDFDVSDGAAIKLYVAYDVELQALLENNHFARLIVIRDDSDTIVTDSLYTSLQDAIDAASAGQLLELHDGDYQRASIDKSLTLLAINGASATISGAGVNQGWGLRIAAGVSDVSIGASNQGLSINTSAGDLAAVYAVGNNRNLQLSNNILDGGNGHAFLAGGSGGAGLSDSSLSDNQFSNNGSVPTVYVNGQASLSVDSSGVSFTDNQFSSTAAGNGVLLGLETDDATVSGNSFTGASSYALLEIWNAGASISDNSFDNSGSGSVFRDSGSHYNMTAFVAANEVSDVAYIDAGHVLYNSIQAVIDAAVDGELVRLSQGNFIEDVSMATAGISLIGNSEASLIGRLDISADDISVSGLDLSDPGGGYGIVVNGASNISLSNNHIHHIGSDPGYSGT